MHIVLLILPIALPCVWSNFSKDRVCLISHVFMFGQSQFYWPKINELYLEQMGVQIFKILVWYYYISLRHFFSMCLSICIAFIVVCFVSQTPDAPLYLVLPVSELTKLFVDYILFFSFAWFQIFLWLSYWLIVFACHQVCAIMGLLHYWPRQISVSVMERSEES